MDGHTARTYYVREFTITHFSCSTDVNQINFYLNCQYCVRFVLIRPPKKLHCNSIRCEDSEIWIRSLNAGRLQFSPGRWASSPAPPSSQPETRKGNSICRLISFYTLFTGTEVIDNDSLTTLIALCSVPEEREFICIDSMCSCNC